MSGTTKNIPTASKILAKGLKKASGQLMDGDIDMLSKTIGMHTNTIGAYLRGDVRDFNTGSVILTEAKKLINNREQFAIELVA